MFFNTFGKSIDIFLDILRVIVLQHFSERSFIVIWMRREIVWVPFDSAVNPLKEILVFFFSELFKSEVELSLP